MVFADGFNLQFQNNDREDMTERLLDRQIRDSFVEP